MKIFEFVNDNEWILYIVVANSKEEAIQKILDYMTKEVSKETTINNLQNNSMSLANLQHQLNTCKVLAYNINEYVGVYS